MLRVVLGNDGKAVRGVVHTSDSSVEALDHLRCLGLEHSPSVVSFLQSKQVVPR